MNPTDQSNDRPAPTGDIGDQNVERLVGDVYHPEPLDPDFVRRVRQRAESEAERQQQAQTARRSHVTLAPAATWLFAAAALVLLLVAGTLAIRSNARRTDQPIYYRDGPMVWIEGQAFRPATPTGALSAADQHATGPSRRPTAAAEQVPRINAAGLTPRARPARGTGVVAAVGETITTHRGERRRFELPDGSVVYVNQETTVEVRDARRLVVTDGEVFVDVSPASEHGGARFVVQTPQREVTALGTKFAVEVTGSETDVAVAQGKVTVSGITPPILAGQQLRLPHAGDAIVPPVTPLPRTSHVLDWTRDLMAAAESPLVPGSEHRGGALVAVDPEGQQAKLSLRNYHIDVHLEDGFARTTIDQIYFNHLNGRLEGTFYFPLPADASISRLAMYVNGKLMEGGMAEREHAREVFETIKHRALDPALLEWIDGSTFKMRVFPLEGRQEKRIVLSYTQRLGNHYGRTDYRFPAGHSMDAVRNWSVRLHLVAGQQQRWECSSHDLKASTAGGDLTLTLSETDVKPDRDVVLALFDTKVSQPDDAQPDDDTNDETVAQPARFAAVEHEGARYTMLRYRPTLPVVERRSRRDWIFLFDADGSRDPLLGRVQVDIIRSLLENAEHDDTFSVLKAATRVHHLTPEPWPVTDEKIAAAVTMLDQTQLIGALNLEQALGSCHDLARTLEHPIVVHVGSAIPILGERATDQLLESWPVETPYVGVGVGRRWNRALMKAAASHSGGYFTQINPDETTGWRAFELLATLNSPRLLDLHVTTDTEQVFYLDRDSVADGEEICAIIRQEPGQPQIQAVTVSGSLDGAPFRRTLPVQAVAENANYLPRTWAKLAIDDMLARGGEAHRGEIIELSKRMYVMSPFTSLLVLENDAMYEQYNVDRGRQDHWALYPCPAEIDVVHEPFAGPELATTPAPDAVSEQAISKPSCREVLLTLFVRTAPGGNITRQQVLVRGDPTWDVPWGLWTTNTTEGSLYVPGRVLLGGIAFNLDGFVANPLPADPFDGDPFDGDPFDGDPFDVNPLPFSNPSPGDAPTSLMLMVTPRIIIQEEEEEPLLRGFGGGRNGRAVDADFDELIDLIQRTIRPDTWDEVGGPGTMETFPSQLSLVISQTQSVNDRRADASGFLGTRVYPVGDFALPATSLDAGFFNAMVEVDTNGSEPSVSVAIPFPDATTWETLTSQRQRYRSVDLSFTAAEEDAAILKTLGNQADFNYSNLSLRKVIDDLAWRHNIPLLIDSEALEDAGIGTDSPVTIRVKGVTLRSALRLMLRELKLTFTIKDARLYITTPEAAERLLITHVYPRSFWCDETLCLLPLRRVGDRARKAAHDQLPARAHNRTEVNRLAGQLRQHWKKAESPANLLYPAGVAGLRQGRKRPLISFARGITTTRSDALAVLEQEADLGPPPRIGTIDDAARALIDAARREGWHRVTRRDADGNSAWQLTVDGQGRFWSQQRTEHGLNETIISDGKTLRHLYPELGLGTTRSVSRFHRADLAKVVPWLVPPTEDLTIGADVRLIGPRLIAVAAHRDEAAVDERGDPRPYQRVHLEFSASGRLAARHLVAMPAGQTILRVTYDDAGTVRWYDADNRLQHESTLTVEPTAAPDLQPEVSELVLLPMPIRTRDHVYQTAATRPVGGEESFAATADALRTIVVEDQQAGRDDPASWSEEDALRLLASLQGQQSDETRNVIGRRFFAQGDRRLGFYTLLAATGQAWDRHNSVALGDGTATRMSPLADHPDSELARYLEADLRAEPLESSTPAGVADSTNRFVTQLAEYQRLCLRWHPSLGLALDAETRQREVDQVFDFIQQCDSPHFALTLLRRVQRQFGKDQPHRRIAEQLIRLEARGLTSYIIKYELARSLAEHGKQPQARQLFMELYRDSLEAGIVPPIDQAFQTALQQREAKFWPHEDSGKNLGGFMRGACAELILRGQRQVAITLAWQCHQLGETGLAGELVDQALSGLSTKHRLATSLEALNFLVAVGDHRRAIAVVQPLLASEPSAESPELWRVAAEVAHRGGMLARAVQGLERAADLEYANLSEQYDVAEVREMYTQLFTRYQALAQVVVADAADDSPLNLATRVVQAADRWRSLDTDVTAACQQAATLLNQLGHDELAWDYLTTPLAAKPNEAAAWLRLAQRLQSDQSIDLADRAYDEAWRAEPTNAKILWDHAQMLDHAGRLEAARQRYQQLVDGDWQPRFRPIQGRAQRIIAATEDR